MDDVIKTECRKQVMEIVLNRPESLNAMSIPLIEGLLSAVERAENPDVRAVLIRGEGRGFCSGGDIAFFKEVIEEGKGVPRNMPDDLHQMIENLRALSKPVIAAVHGPAAGAGMSLMLACDLALASDNAVFNLAYVGIGLSPDGGSSYFLPRHLGVKRAMETFLMPRSVSAQEACELGLINRVVPADKLLNESRALAQQLAQGPTTAFGNVKKLVQQSFANSIHDQLALETDFICSTSQTEDFQAGVSAFLAKEKPRFVGK